MIKNAFIGLIVVLLTTLLHSAFGDCLMPRKTLRRGRFVYQKPSDFNLTTVPEEYSLRFQCSKGYELTAPDNISCQDGQWTDHPPHCIRLYCQRPPSIPNGRFIFQKRVSRYSRRRVNAKYLCDTGFAIINQSSSLTCSWENKTLVWKGKVPSCKATAFCPHPPAVTNGLVVGNYTGYYYLPNDEAEVACNPGFRYHGEMDYITCQQTFEWDGELGECRDSYGVDNSEEVIDAMNTIVTEKEKEQPGALLQHNMTLMLSSRIDVNYPERRNLYFIFDVSNNVGINDFLKIKQFAKALVEKIGISKNGTRAAALTYTNSKTENHFRTIQFRTTENVLEALDAIEYTQKRTSPISALNMVGTLRKFDQRNVKSVVVVFTDGAVLPYKDTDEVKLLIESDVEIYCIGITDRVLEIPLYNMATEPQKEHVFFLHKYKTFNGLVQEITGRSDDDYSQCGVGLENLARKQHGRIVGGAKVVTPWPWMAALYFIQYDGNIPLEPKLECSGSIISRQWILTAAHCLYRRKSGVLMLRKEKDVIIKLGLTEVENHNNLQEFDVDYIFIHPQYNNQTEFDYDIALIRLIGFIELNPYVRPICLPDMKLSADTKLYKPHQHVYTSGWGYTEKVATGEHVKTITTKYLKELMMPLQLRERCEKSIQDIFHENPNGTFTERMFCAGSGHGDGDTCHGDSGGPAMQPQYKDNKVYWIVVGIISWGISCGQPDTYGFYTNVHSILPWISATMATPVDEKNLILTKISANF